MNETVFLGELAWPEAAKRMASGAPVFLPVGATEQHGHHMSLNVDVVIPTAIAERAARLVNGLVAPTIPYGNRSQPRSGGGRQFPGTLNLRAGTLSLVIRDVLVELNRQKAKKIVVLNGHYENIWPIIEGIEMALDAIDRKNCEGLNIIRIDHWELLSPETLARVFPDGYPGIELEHASVIETSMMLALRPELVDLAKALHDGPAKFRPYDRYPEPPDEVPASGVLSLTEGSTAEKGNWLLGDCLEKIVQIVRHEFSTN